eukprot:6195317-Pleurochrysis_carterae.AAC.1
MRSSPREYCLHATAGLASGAEYVRESGGLASSPTAPECPCVSDRLSVCSIPFWPSYFALM